ncbi:MAG: hypothetical protein GWO08_05125 [Gammaproteobacteria bacterium]|nr:hypothetical protein [Gammaproteobacteria bacterium]NIN62160.1 hypothetical protein [Gammaproteobacteria bacterium]NIO61898.1 hypothetical protein [Gammaproteobacteria bacterium]NIP49052.1 hypothetical protein [Gammaproteobacteria bacterium]NIQ09508.1 hypothetical protein [Gammaproteobacteria bacterium]
MTNEILELFNAHKGIVCCVGAGGKKTTMFRLAQEHAGRRGITATSHIEYFPRKLKITKHIAEEDELLQLVKNDPSDCIAFACPSTRKGRHAGISIDNVKRFQETGQFDLLVIKSDGARNRAPALGLAFIALAPRRVSYRSIHYPLPGYPTPFRATVISSRITGSSIVAGIL